MSMIYCTNAFAGVLQVGRIMLSTTIKDLREAEPDEGMCFRDQGSDTSDSGLEDVL